MLRNSGSEGMLPREIPVSASEEHSVPGKELDSL